MLGKMCEDILTCEFVLQVSSNLKILEQHASTHADEWTKERCWPNDFK